MKTLLVVIGLLMACGAKSQIIKNESDPFTKEKRVETADVVLELTDETRLAVSFRSVGDTYFITFIGYGHGPEVIGATGQAMILLENDSVVTVTSTGAQTYALNYSTKSYRHQYSISKADLVKLAGNGVKAVRRYGLQTYVDINISQKTKLQETAKVFLDAL